MTAPNGEFDALVWSYYYTKAARAETRDPEGSEYVANSLLADANRYAKMARWQQAERGVAAADRVRVTKYARRYAGAKALKRSIPTYF